MFQRCGMKQHKHVFVISRSLLLNHHEPQTSKAKLLLPIMPIGIVAYAFTLLWDNPRQPLSKQLYKPHTTHNSSIRFEEGLTLQTEAFQSYFCHLINGYIGIIRLYFSELIPIMSNCLFKNLMLKILLYLTKNKKRNALFKAILVLIWVIVRPSRVISCRRSTLKADLHGTTLSLKTSLRQAYDMNCFL